MYKKVSVFFFRLEGMTNLVRLLALVGLAQTTVDFGRYQGRVDQILKNQENIDNFDESSVDAGITRVRFFRNIFKTPWEFVSRWTDFEIFESKLSAEAFN